MKNYFILYKPFLVFLGKFLMTYFVLTFLYESYLNQFDPLHFEVDGFTQLVSNQSVGLQKFFGFEVHESINNSEVCVNIFFNNRFVAKIIEGCNGLSVIIMFVAFVVAFTGNWKPTVLYIIGGSLLIHLVNVFRIAVLCVLMFYYPKYEHVLHSVVFPLIIYGLVFLLWVIWVNKFSVHAKKNIKK